MNSVISPSRTAELNRDSIAQSDFDLIASEMAHDGR